MNAGSSASRIAITGQLASRTMLADQVERVLGVLTDPDDRDIEDPLLGERGDRSDVGLSRDHAVAEARDHERDLLQMVGAFVREEDPQGGGVWALVPFSHDIRVRAYARTLQSCAAATMVLG